MLFLTHHIRRNFLKVILSALILPIAYSGSAQMSYGGSPLPLNASSYARNASAQEIPFVEMPAFDNTEARASAESGGLKFKSLTFAHKFYVHLRPDNSGINFQAGGVRVWRVGIRSKDAYSLNILFTKFRLPRDAQVFVYNADQTEVLGSYTHQNNTDDNLLPVQPIGSDEIIVEYQEPYDAEFKGEIEIGEVNHDFRGLFRATEPRDPTQTCFPDILCHPELKQAGEGVVALIINGDTYCTGVLVNNAANNGTPYLLTATHCLNDDYSSLFLSNRKYDVIGGTIVAFFGYQSPVCDEDIRGPVQLTMASVDSVLISERYDISLLKFKQTPPKEYQPLYLGWNVSSSPQGAFYGIHQPNGGNKKASIENDALAIGSFTNPKYNMEPNAHWAVRAWDTGATEGGSSGSPLLDKNQRVLGTLTGGESMCEGAKGPDVYASLHKAWNVTGSLGNPNSLQIYLDPNDTQFQQIDAFDPYANEPYTRSQNYSTTEVVTQTFHNSVPMFATNNTFGYTEFAEEFQASETVRLDGVFMASTSTNFILNKNIVIKVYSDKDGPATVIHDQPLNYSFRYHDNGSFPETGRDMRHNVENYTRFTAPVTVSGKFYIAYVETTGMSSGFSVLNVEPRKVGAGIESTAWMKNASGWIRSSENIENPINTSLLISPYVIGQGLSPITPEEEPLELKTYYDPAVDRIFIESNKELLSWEVFYVSGQKIMQGTAENSINRTSIPSSALPHGVYIVKVNSDNETTIRKVLVR